MSSLRIIGLLIGLLGLVLTFRVYRGPKWKRLNFVLSGIFSIVIIAVSLNPDLLNRLAGMLALKQQERGRILTLLIFSTVVLWFLLLNYRARLGEHRHQFDLLIRNFGHEEVKHILQQQISDKKIVIILPAYNEGKNLGRLLEKIPKKINDMEMGTLVVDDGSDDDTYNVAKQAGAW